MQNVGSAYTSAQTKCSEGTDKNEKTMKKRNVILAITVLLAVATSSAQTVTNVTAEQVGKTIHVSYDLDKQADITLFVSTNGGSTYVQLYRVSGDVGENVSAGNKTIVWDVLAEQDKLLGENIVFKVMAKGEDDNLTFTVNGVTFKMIYVEGGTFIMGCTSEQEADCYDDEKPAHQVTVSSFYMGETEVTQELWRAMMGDNSNATEGTFDNKAGYFPMECVSWYDCLDFVRKLNQLTGKTFRLPTEAEWEYAARGGNKKSGYKYAGGSNAGDVAWYQDNSDYETHPVKGKWPNELGLYDMSGNVWEWCSDRFGDYSSTAQTNPSGPSSGKYRVVRGGSYEYIDRGLRVSSRTGYYPDFSCSDNDGGEYGSGFRLVIAQPTPCRVNFTSDEIDFTVKDVDFKMVFVKGGTFNMGGTSEQGQDCYIHEKPVHQVTLSDFWIGEVEVTQDLWQTIMNSSILEQRNKANFDWPIRGEGPSYPIYYVNYNEAIEFCRKLNIEFRNDLPNGYKFTLPTEAQWEYAARGGCKSQQYKFSGSNIVGDVAWYMENSTSTTHPVKTKKSNELGLFDMSGNVWEWCLDWYGQYSSSFQTNPEGPSSGAERVLRGGSWNFNDRYCRVSFRRSNAPDERDDKYGFRLALIRE